MASDLRDYELMVILSPNITEEEFPASLERLQKSIASGGGEVVEVNNWGRRRLAYPIKSHLEGNYVLSQVRLDPGQIPSLENTLRISEEVIRHLLVKAEE